MEKEVREGKWEVGGDAIRINAHKFDLGSCALSVALIMSYTQKHTRLSAFVPCQTLTQHTQTETYSHTQLLTDLTGKEEGNVGFCTHIS